MVSVASDSAFDASPSFRSDVLPPGARSGLDVLAWTERNEPDVLCIQHLAMIDYLCFAGTAEGRVCEYVDHLHEHFVEPCVVRNAAYMPPKAPGFSIEMKPATLANFVFDPSKRASAAA